MITPISSGLVSAVGSAPGLGATPPTDSRSVDGRETGFVNSADCLYC